MKIIKLLRLLFKAKKEKIERVISKSFYTALEAESTYYNPNLSKLFVDRIVELLPKRWVAAQHITLLPRNKKVKS